MVNKFKEWLAGNQTTASLIFAVTVFGIFILVGALIPSSESNVPAEPVEETIVEDNDSDSDGSILDDESIFSSGWIEEQTIEPAVSELGEYQIYFTPRLDNESYATESWNSVLTSTFDALTATGFNASNNFVSAYNTLYDAREIMSPDSTVVFADAALNSDDPKCGFNGELLAVAGGLETYAAPLPLSVSQNNFAFITDFDRDETYASTLETVGFYTIVGEENGLVFVGISESWQEVVFVNVLLNEDNTMRVAGRQILSKYPVLEELPERALLDEENLNELVLNSHLSMLNKSVDMVYEDDFWISGDLDKDYVLKFYKEQHYGLENPVYKNITVTDLTSIVSQLESFTDYETATLTYNFDDSTAYQLEMNEDGEFNILTLTGDITNYVCSTTME